MRNNPLAPITPVSPRERAQMRGLTREVVGGNAVKVNANLPVKQPTGHTVPLNVTNLSVAIFQTDFSRKFLFVQNNDALGIVFVTIGDQDAALNQGFRLGPNGGSILLDVNVPTGRVSMIGTLANNPNVTAITG